MSFRKRVLMVCLAVLTLRAGSLEAQVNAAPSGSSRTVKINVVVTPKSGAPVAGLAPDKFTLLDNKVQRAPTSFREVKGRDATAEVVLLIDAVNAPFETVAFVRDQMKQYFGAAGEQLAQPTSIALMTDKGVQVQEHFSRDSKELRASIDQANTGLRTINRSSGFYGAAERYQISLRGLSQLATREAARPGRKVIVFLSPGWPVFAAPNQDLGLKEQKQIFGEAVNLSTQLRLGEITLYSVDPIGAGESEFRVTRFEQFLPGVSAPGDAYPGNLALQVLALQSGGLALSSSNDLRKSIERCVADLDAYYEITFEASSAEHPDDYHHLEVRVAGEGLTARTTQGYYAQP